MYQTYKFFNYCKPYFKFEYMIEGKKIIKYSDESEASFEARKLWYDFRESVYHENRFFIKHKLLDMLLKYISNNVLEIEIGKIYYRARIIDESCIYEHMMYKCCYAPENERLDVNYRGKSNPFKCLTKEASFVPPKGVNVSEGRANPKYIKYLYVSESPTTAIFEVRPFVTDNINIAKIQVNDTLKIANIAVELDLSSNKDATIEMYIMRMIQGTFSYPTNNSDDYILTQVIAEYIKSLGYDGIRFNSSIHSDGVNLTIFNYNKCEPISSQDFKIEDIKLTGRATINSVNCNGDLHCIKDNIPIYFYSSNNSSIK